MVLSMRKYGVLTFIEGEAQAVLQNNEMTITLMMLNLSHPIHHTQQQFASSGPIVGRAGIPIPNEADAVLNVKSRRRGDQRV